MLPKKITYIDQETDPTKKILDQIKHRAKESQSNAVIIKKKGEILLHYFSNESQHPIEAMSVTKSIVSLGIGILIDEKKLFLEDPIYKFYPEWKQGGKKHIQLKHLLVHTSGIQTEKSTEEIYTAPDFVQLALAAELSEKPGSRFFYNNKAVNLLAGIIKKASNHRMDHFIERKLFKPLDISDFSWTLDSAGNPHSMSGLQIKAEDLAKIGELILNKGKWNNHSIISENWIRLSMQPEPLSNRAAQGITYLCGLLWWLHDHPATYCAEGYLGQYLIILPEQHIVAIRQMSATTHFPLLPADTFPDFITLVRQL